MRRPGSAHTMVSQALHNGTLIKQPCGRCGAPNVQAHHDDYDKPLDVTWLCVSCHQLLHAEMKRQKLGRVKVSDKLITLNLPADMTRAIDNYWHSEQLRSRNEAIRELLRQALNKHLVDLVDQVAKPAKEQRRG